MNKSILSFGAHPDDIELGCGGTELLLRDAGYAITHVCLTSGEAGSDVLAAEELRVIREREAREAARMVGAGLELFNLPDGHVRSSQELQRRLITLVRRVRPEIVFVHTADDRMRDHQEVHAMVVDAVTVAAGPWHAGCGEPHRVRSMFGYEVWDPLRNPGWVVDITATLGRKLEMLGCHASQMSAIDYRAASEGLARYRGVMSGRSKAAEAFEILRCEPKLS